MAGEEFDLSGKFYRNSEAQEIILPLSRCKIISVLGPSRSSFRARPSYQKMFSTGLLKSLWKRTSEKVLSVRILIVSDSLHQCVADIATA
jgi:hypothetical protein